ncbi:MAG: hypothetical protein ABWY25_06260 [Paenisporosarcina sp.]
MELFKFVSNVYTTVFTEGRMINGALSVLWAERYRDPGEFQIVARLSSGLREFLPIGTFISHANTLEVMVVENHEVQEVGMEDPTIVITGRSLDSYLENRIVGMNQVRASSTLQEYALAANYSWNQIVTLINDHIQHGTYTDDNLVNIFATTNVTGTSPVNEARSVKRENLSKTVIGLLAIDDLGIKSVRRNTFGAADGSPNQTNLCIHRGVDKTASVIFSWKSGTIENAEYLWSDKKMKNSALVLGRYINVVVDTPGMTNANRRSMVVSGDDIDGNLGAPPTGGTLTTVVSKMQVRGREALESQNRITITRADVANVSQYQYRKDFQVGDLISLDGNFGQMAVMRIVEYAEIQDENGENGHPTLAVPGT